MERLDRIIEHIENVENPDEKARVYEMYEILRNVLPDCEETISYGMPAFRYKKRIAVYFAAAKKHIGYYPTGTGIEAFESQLSGYKYSKGAVQFSYKEPLPKELIEDIARFRVKEIEGGSR